MDASWRKTHRVLPRPRPVWVDPAEAFPAVRFGYRGVTLRTRAYGICRSDTFPGVLLAWYRLDNGDWWGLTRFTATSGNGRLALDLTQLVPAAALSPRAEGPTADAATGAPASRRPSQPMPTLPT